MRRREFLALTGSALAFGALGACLPGANRRRGAVDALDTSERPGAITLDAAAFRAERRFADLACGRIAYVERGAGARGGRAALFLHGAPLNGFQWRGAIERVSTHQRSIAPDFMGLGYSEVPERQSLRADAQVAMLVALLEERGVSRADVVASDSGGAVAQLLLAHHPERVRTLLLTNCDVEPDSPPAKVQPVIQMAREGRLADATAPWLADKPLARATFGAAVYRDPVAFADETIETYFAPLVSSPVRRAQYEAFHVAFEPNPLAGIEAELRRSGVPVRIVWGMRDDIFSFADAEYLDRTFPGSRGIRRVEEGKLFFQEEFPELIAEEALALSEAP